MSGASRRSFSCGGCSAVERRIPRSSGRSGSSGASGRDRLRSPRPAGCLPRRIRFAPAPLYPPPTSTSLLPAAPGLFKVHRPHTASLPCRTALVPAVALFSPDLLPPSTPPRRSSCAVSLTAPPASSSSPCFTARTLLCPTATPPPSTSVLPLAGPASSRGYRRAACSFHSQTSASQHPLQLPHTSAPPLAGLASSRGPQRGVRRTAWSFLHTMSAFQRTHPLPHSSAPRLAGPAAFHRYSAL